MIRWAMRCLMAAFVLLGSAGAWSASERHLLLISDLHVGAGRDAQGAWQRTEDFRWQTEFDSFLAWAGTTSANQTDLVLVGDVFELWQSPTMNCSTDITQPTCEVPDCHEADKDIGCSEVEARARLDHILAQHPGFTAALLRFAQAGSNQVILIPGNHDAALLFPRVGQALMQHFKGARVRLQTQGHWLSGDGQIYADHGHQADLLNRYAGWPSPFVDQGGQRYLRKPWGENMVQQFYNQYEQIFPIIDNLADEATGVRYAMAQAGFAPSVTAFGRLFRFLLFEESLRQAATALGPGDAVAWDRAWVRRQNLAFFVEALGGNPGLAQDANRAQQRGALVLDRASLSDREVDALCMAKAHRAAVMAPALAPAAQAPSRAPRLTPCKRLGREGAKLGRLVQGALLSDDQVQIQYLRDTLPRVARKPGDLAAVYVFGHTHSAAPERTLSLGDLALGNYDVRVINTGAFQRIVSEAQIQAILEGPARSRAAAPLDLQPEDLPDCYNFVWVEPYALQPDVKLWRWARSGLDAHTASPGTCLSRPL